MKTKNTIVLFLATLLSCFAVPAQAAHYKVILLGGQSNMDGRAPGSGLPTSPVNLQAAQTDVKLYHGNASGNAYLPGNTWIDLAPGSGSKSPSSPTFGPEVTFGRAIADAYPSENFALIKYALGGSKLATQWYAPNGPVYTAFQNTVTNGLAALTSAGHTYEIAAMGWMQGESDSTTAYANAYEANLTALIADVRVRYGANLPFVIGETWRNEGDATHPGTLGDIVSGAQQAVADADPRVGFVSTRNASLFPFQDAYHLNASGQMNLGYGMADYLIDNNLLTDLPSPVSMAAAPIALSPIADSYIRVSDTAASTHGTETYMVTNNGTGSGKLRWSFMKFDLSGLVEPIVGIKLELQASKEGNNFPALSHAIYGLTTGEDWTEAGLNYTNAPAKTGNAIDMAGVYGNDAIATFDYAGVVSGNAGGPVAAVIDQAAGGDAVNFIRADSDKVITFIIARTGSASDSGVAWATKECTYAEVAKPVLIVYTGVVDTPDPADGQGLATDPASPLYTGVEVGRTLSWQAVSDPNLDLSYTPTYAVYADPNETNVVTGNSTLYYRGFDDSNASARVFDPAENLDHNTPYYWRVDSKIRWVGKTEPNIVPGHVWTFETLSLLPTILTDPADQKVFTSEEAAFTVTYESLGTITDVVWYKDGSPLSSGFTWDQTTSTLTIAAASASDEGTYYCDVTTTESVASDSARLMLKKKLAWYQFENNADDSAGTNHGTPVNGMLYAASGLIPGQAYAANPDGTNYVMLPNAACYPRAGLNSGLDQGSIACWVKCEPGQGGYILGQNAGTGGYITSLQLYVDSGNANAFLRDDDNQSVTLAGAKVDDGQWHYVVLTIDGGTVTLYVDVTNAKSGSNALDKYTEWDHDMPIMAFNNRGTLGSFFTGDLDDLVILNYPMSPEEMAQAYFDVTAEPSCLYSEKPELAYDFDGNCKIDLADFAMLAGKWSESGLYPLQ